MLIAGSKKTYKHRHGKEQRNDFYQTSHNIQILSVLSYSNSQKAVFAGRLLLFVQLVFAAVTRFVFVIFVAAIANARELFTASRAFHTVEICIFIDADGVAARGAFHFDEIIVVAATAVAIVIIAIAAVTVVAVEFFFESA
jgi:hypothetical protein